jgi:tetratricopeptide (TPR) repeat protein
MKVALFIYALASLLGAASPVFGERAFIRGEELFMENKPGEALPYLEAAASEEPDNIPAFLYLGMACLQLDRADDAIAVYLRALSRGGKERAWIAYNLGNIYYVKENYPQADSYYSLAIEADPALASAYLNRANAKISQQAFKEAVTDYERYLALEPRASQRAQIEALIAYIRGESIAGEARRQAEEQQRQTEEQQRREEEQRRQAELASAAAGAAEELRRFQAELAASAEAERRRQIELSAASAAAEERHRAEIAAALMAERRRQSGTDAEDAEGGAAEDERYQAERAALEERYQAELAAAVEAERQRQIELAAKAEEERRRLLLEELSASLHAAAEDSQGLSTGAEEVETYDGEFELE